MRRVLRYCLPSTCSSAGAELLPSAQQNPPTRHRFWPRMDRLGNRYSVATPATTTKLRGYDAANGPDGPRPMTRALHGRLMMTCGIIATWKSWVRRTQRNIGWTMNA